MEHSIVVDEKTGIKIFITVKSTKNRHYIERFIALEEHMDKIFDTIGIIALSPFILVSIVYVTAYEALTMSKEDKEKRKAYNGAVMLHIKHGTPDPDEYPLGRWPPISPKCTGRCNWDDEEES